MAMIVALIGNLLGMLGGVLPDIMKLVSNWQNTKSELKMLEAQHKWQLEAEKARTTAKLGEWEQINALEMTRAIRDQVTAAIDAGARPTGIVWIDALNALMRPLCTFGIMAMFFCIAIPFTWVVVGRLAQGDYSPETAAKAIFTSLIGDAIMGCLGFLYGYRSTAKK